MVSSVHVLVMNHCHWLHDSPIPTPFLVCVSQSHCYIEDNFIELSDHQHKAVYLLLSFVTHFLFIIILDDFLLPLQSRGAVQGEGLREIQMQWVEWRVETEGFASFPLTFWFGSFSLSSPIKQLPLANCPVALVPCKLTGFLTAPSHQRTVSHDYNSTPLSTKNFTIACCFS